ncbi:gluconokinase, GntK/IdnK-type [Leifsonia naganoensis]|uniref:Gluconokinase n=1 Tax=Leifsonia naganoensis TaxID=150025 RepID=A0A853DJL7_9MICO|nr:gluconokinase [Leifsonia naganoensis]
MSDAPAVVVVMGVSGSGKSVFGAALAASLGRGFLDADDLHPPANKARMAAGVPLEDADRWPWLDTVAETGSAAGDVVIACSALRRAYRDRLRLRLPAAVFVQLDVAVSELERRLAGRSHEFMPASLLTSQLDLLEPLERDERGVVLAIAPGRSIDAMVAEAGSALRDLSARTTDAPSVG